MVKTFQGYFQEGRFIASEPVDIPDNVEAYVMITDREYSHPTAKPQRQLEAFNRFISALSSIDDEPLSDDDFFELENNRADFRRASSL